MVVRRLVLVPAALLLVSATVFAQATPPAAPAGVEQDLRARVGEFFQYFVDGKFRQAISLVADDTQDEYFSSPKAEMRAFKIDAINYSSDFTKAEVVLTVKQIWHLKAEGFLQDTAVETPMATTWKIENGKWVFYKGPPPENGWVTPMGPSQGFRKPDGAVAIPKKLDDATINAEAERLLHQTTVDRNQVTIVTDKPSSEKVVFHNGAEGYVSITVGVPNVLPPGFSAKLDKQEVGAGQDAILEIRYDPVADKPAPVGFLSIAVDVAPFNQRYPIQINFSAPPK